MLFVWTYRNNWLAVRWPLIAINSCIFIPLSNLLDVASWRRSWNMRSVKLARIPNISHAWRKAISVTGKGPWVSRDIPFSLPTAVSLKGTCRDKPFLVIGKRPSATQLWLQCPMTTHSALTNNCCLEAWWLVMSQLNARWHFVFTTLNLFASRAEWLVLLR